MKLLIHNNLGTPLIVDSTRVVVLDKYDNPVAFAVEVDDGVIITETLSEKNEAAFNNAMRSLGLTKSVIVTEASQTPLPQIRKG